MEIGDICLACGVCCTGVLFTEAPMRANEQAVVVTIGARPTARGDAFMLPCPAHDGSKCTTYDRRPHVCHDFECEVLLSVRRGERTVDEALRLIRSLRAKVADTEAIVGGREAGLTLNERIARFLDETPREDPRYNELTLKAIVLNIERSEFVPGKYHDPRESERSVMGATPSAVDEAAQDG